MSPQLLAAFLTLTFIAIVGVVGVMRNDVIYSVASTNASPLPSQQHLVYPSILRDDGSGTMDWHLKP